VVEEDTAKKPAGGKKGKKGAAPNKMALLA
jgi:hypothetical protein